MTPGIGRISAALAITALGFAVACGATGREGTMFSGERGEDVTVLKDRSGEPILRYVHGKLPEGEARPSVEGTSFTHPLYTPSGAVVTDVAPADHPHHRGVFCAWVHVDGEKSGDWWGWGALAPKEQRVIVNREARVADTGTHTATFRAINDWAAEDQPVLQERVTVTARHDLGCNVVDYEYRFTAPTRKPVVLRQNPFGGFCYRAKPRGKQVITGPQGTVDLKDSVFNKTETNWPAARWYDMTYYTPDGKVNGVAVMDHPQNPRSTWHVVRGIHMLNPCVVAEGPVTIPFGEPLTLRYRLVAHDGDATAVDLPRLYTEFAAEK